MAAIPLCLLLNEPHVFCLTQQRLYFNSVGYLYMYAAWPKHVADMSR